MRETVTSGAAGARRLLSSVALIGVLIAGALIAANFSGGPFDPVSDASAASNRGAEAKPDKSDKSDQPDKPGDDSGSGSTPIPGGLNALPPRYTDCEGSKVSQPFLLWGDIAEYVEVANGSFDLGFAGWELKGKTDAARLVPTYRGVVLQAGEGVKVLSPPICFDETRPHARMLTRIVGGDDEQGKVEVEVHYRKLTGNGIKQIDVGEFNQDQSSTLAWTASPRMGTALGAVRKIVRPDANGHRWFQYEFKIKGKALWQFDDLFVDPRRRT